MNIVTLGSDKSLVGAPALGDAVDRHASYGIHVGRLDVIVYTNRREQRKVFPISANVMGYPTNSLNKVMFWFDAARIFREIYKQRKVDIVVCQDPFVFGLLGVYLKYRYKCKLQINFHGDFWSNQNWRQESWLNPWFERLSRFTVKQADAIRSVSTPIAAKLQAFGVPSDRLHVIPTPVQKPQAQGTIKHYQLGFRYLVSDVRLVVTKNIFFMIDVFASLRQKHPEFKLWIIGDGPLRPDIEKYIQQKSLTDSVYCLGLIPHDELGLYFQKAEAQLLFSTHESFGKVIIEAGLWHCPTVATATTGATSIIRPNSTGILIPHNDASAAMTAIESIISNQETRQRLGRAAAEDYGQRFERQAIMTKIINLWKSLARL
mgnify:FL=1